MAEIASGTTVHLRLGMALQESGHQKRVDQTRKGHSVIVFTWTFTRSRAAGEVHVVLSIRLEAESIN